MLTRSNTRKRRPLLFSATRLSNYVKNDMVLDYLDKLDENGKKLDENLCVVRKRSRSDDLNQNNPVKKIKFEQKSTNTNLCNISTSTSILGQNNYEKTSFDYIIESGYAFENDIIKQIKQMMFENGESYKIYELAESNAWTNCDLTISSILSNKYTIIMGSNLINNKNNTWGKPDLLVKGEWIKKYIKSEICHVNLSKWYVIDIKSSTIVLINKGEEISNSLLFNAYRTQVFVYTEALNNLLYNNGINNNVKHGFILGKKYKYVIDKNVIFKKPFEFLGTMDFNKNAFGKNSWHNVILKAVDWNNDLKLNWEKFSLNPINKNELYPNMKNHYDGKWHGIKKEIAIKNKEITLLWNCGISNRKLAWDKGIKNYSDTKLNAKILGFENTSKELIIETMLKLLPSNKNFYLSKLNNLNNWQTKSKWEFFVDFETFNSDTIYDEYFSWDDMGSGSTIYMIGVCYYDSNNKLIHKSFVLEYDGFKLIKKIFDLNKNSEIHPDSFADVKFNDIIFCSSEKKLIEEFGNFILGFKPAKMDIDKFKQEIRLCHWSSAESSIFGKKLEELNFSKSSINKFKFNWFDLLKIFKHSEYPIVIKECFGFGLKEIVKKLNQYGYINLSWSDLDDGLLSSFIARDIYTKEEQTHNIQMHNIIEYNYVDCKALHCVLDWMRKTVQVVNL